MSKSYIVNCYTCQHNGQETCKGCNTLLNGENEPYENWQLREDLKIKDQRIAELEEQLKNATKQVRKEVCEEIRSRFLATCQIEKGCDTASFSLEVLNRILDQIQDKGEKK